MIQVNYGVLNFLFNVYILGGFFYFASWVELERIRPNSIKNILKIIVYTYSITIHLIILLVFFLVILIRFLRLIGVEYIIIDDQNFTDDSRYFLLKD